MRSCPRTCPRSIPSGSSSAPHSDRMSSSCPIAASPGQITTTSTTSAISPTSSHRKGDATLADHDVADREVGTRTEPQHVEDEERLNAFDTTAPTVQVVVVEWLAVGFERADLD